MSEPGEKPTNSPIGAEKPINVTGEFQELRDKRTEELTKSFVEGGLALAKLKDPVRQFELFAEGNFAKTLRDRIRAQQQLIEIANEGDVNVGRMFDTFMGMYVFRVNPGAFLETVQKASQANVKDNVWEKKTKESIYQHFSKIPKKEKSHLEDIKEGSVKISEITLQDLEGYMARTIGELGEKERNK